METANKYTKEELETILEKMAEGSEYGVILRAKGIVSSEDGKYLHFDMVPGEFEVREGTPDITGRLCVIGTTLNEDAIREAFRV